MTDLLDRALQWMRPALAGATFAIVGSTAAQVSVTATGVGPGPTNYATLNAAFTAINAGTHQGAITCTITANTTEPGTAVPLLASGTGSSSYTSILIRPSGDRVVASAATPTSSRGVIEIQGADNVTIDGDDPLTSGIRNLTFQAATSTNTGVAVVRFASTSTTNGATFCTIRNCIVIGSRSSTSSAVTNYGIYSGTSGTGSTSTSGQSDNNDNLTIENNEVKRCYWGIYVAGTSSNVCDNLIIRNNLVGSTVAADAVANRGIYLQNTQASAGAASATVQGNDIQLTASSGSTAAAVGIEVASTNAGAQIVRNNIHDSYHANTSGYGMYGIHVTGSTNNAGVTIANNFIRDLYNDNWTATISATSTDLPVGIRVSVGATGLRILSNSVSLNTPNTDNATAGISACLQLTVTGATGSDIRNNIFSNTQTGPAGSKYFGVVAVAGFPWGTINNNAYAANSAINIIGWQTSDRTTLAAWQSVTSQDGASITTAAPFQASTDLHINTSNPNASAYNGTGASGTGITVDYDGDARGTPPDIGGDEFILLTCSSADGGTITPGSASACAGGTYVMTSSGIGSGAGITNQWMVSNVSGGPYSNVSGGSGATTATYTTGTLSVGTYYYILRQTCSTGPVSDDSNELTLTVNPVPVVSASNNGPACVGGSVALDGTTDIAGTYSWSGPNGFAAGTEDATVTPLVLASAGVYSFTTTAAGCTSSPATTTVVVNPAPVVTGVTATPNPACFNGNSQLLATGHFPTAASNYTMVASGGSFTPLSGATAVATIQTDDQISAALPIGFTFPYAGGNYTTLRASSNGFLSFNASALNAATNSLSAPAAAQLPLIAPLWDDLDGSATGGSSASYLTSGVAPNRVFTFQWLNWEWNYQSTSAVISFQVKLYEADGRIQFIYRQETGAYNAGTTGGASIGLAGATVGNYLSLDGTGVSPNASNASETSNLTVKPADGQTYTFSPTALSYAWSPSAFIAGQESLQNPLATGVNVASQAYSVNVTAAGCSTTGNVTLTTTAPISDATISGTLSYCAGGSTMLTAAAVDGAGPFTYLWSPGGQTSASITVTAPGSYDCQVSDACGGSVLAGAVVVVENPLPTPVITPGGPIEFCDSGMLSSSIATGNVWSPGGATTQNITVTASGSYSVTVTDGNGCIGSSAPVAVTVRTTPTGVTANASDVVVCAGDMVDLTSTANALPATTILSQNFNGVGTPAGWSTVNNSTSGTPANAAWTLRTSPYVYSSVTYSSNDASQFFMTNSDAQGTGGITATQLIGPAMDLSGVTTASLSFWHYYRDIGDTGDSAVVEVSTNGGASWSIAQAYTTTLGSASGFVNATVGLNAYAGQASVTLRFRYRATYDWYWCIDNVSVTGTPLPTFSWTSTPSGFTSNSQNPTGVSVTGNTTYMVTASNGNCSANASVNITLDLTDTDGDEIIDCDDDCPLLAGQQGDFCDADPGAGFLFGQINGSCQCVAVPCTENVTMELRTDALSSQASWEILLQNSDQVVCQFSVAMNGITSPITENCCLPVGCYRLRVMDSGGDGFVSGGITGGYQLRESGPIGRRIIDNLGNFSSGSSSAIAATYENGAFCVPVGNDGLIYSSCDKLDWVNNKFIVAHANAAVTAEFGVTNTTSGYEFWFFDPNGSYSFRRFRNHATSDGYGSGATRACHFKVNGWINSISTPHIPANVLMNVRVRGRVDGNNLPFGPACLFKIDAALAACPRVKLQDDPANTSDYSCGVSRNFGGASSPANRIYANPPQPIPVVASSSVRYQFRFRITGENVCIVRPPQTSARMVLNWTTGTPLQCNKTYEVDVRVSLDGGATWCFGPAGSSEAAACADTEDWGKVCLVTINPCALPNGGGNSLTIQGDGEFTMYPNPNRGDQLFLNLSNVQEGVNTVNVDIYDLTGKRVAARTIAVQDGFVKTNLELNGDLSGGMYMVNITSGDKTYTERLVIQP
ncbi:MAG: T9SS type A sorting domain-containing protein [Flavobacteriales bacterium]|nr:T9SS type A sorting domain-containing protein [Flavobacteriales bacterium]